MRRHSGQQKYAEAVQIARDHNLLVREHLQREGNTYSLYRIMPDRQVCIGRRKSVEALHRLVTRAAGTRPAKSPGARK